MSDLYSPSRASMNAPPVRRDVTTASDRLIESAAATRPWVMLVAIFLFFMVGLMLLFSLFILFSASDLGVATSASIFGTYSTMAALYFALAYFLFKYAKALGRFLESEQTDDFEDAFEAQKSFWKLFGIILLISLVLGIGMVVLVIFAGALAGFGL